MHIDAWLERSDPYLRIVDEATGALVAEFDHEAITQLLQWGDICLEELCCADRVCQHQLVRELLLAACARAVGEGALEGRVSVPARPGESDQATNVIPFHDPSGAPILRNARDN